MTESLGLPVQRGGGENVGGIKEGGRKTRGMKSTMGKDTENWKNEKKYVALACFDWSALCDPSTDHQVVFY